MGEEEEVMPYAPYALLPVDEPYLATKGLKQKEIVRMKQRCFMHTGEQSLVW